MEGMTTTAARSATARRAPPSTPRAADLAARRPRRAACSPSSPCSAPRVGVVAGLLSGPLWLDEAQSVAIARLPARRAAAGAARGRRPAALLPAAARLDRRRGGGRGRRTPAVGRARRRSRSCSSTCSARRLGGPAARPGGARSCSPGCRGSRATPPRPGCTCSSSCSCCSARWRCSPCGQRPSPRAFAGVAACTGALLLTHYWSLFLLAAVGLWHLPALLRRRRAGRCGWSPRWRSARWRSCRGCRRSSTRARTPERRGRGRPSLEALLRTPEMWSAGPAGAAIALALAYVALLALAVRGCAARPRRWPAWPASRSLLAWVSTAVAGGAYVGRYTAVVVPARRGAARARRARAAGPLAAARARRRSLAVGLVDRRRRRPASCARRAARSRTRSPARPPRATSSSSAPTSSGPSVTRLAPDGLRLRRLPDCRSSTERVDWVDYADRQDAADPGAVARRGRRARRRRRRCSSTSRPATAPSARSASSWSPTLAALRGEPAIEVAAAAVGLRGAAALPLRRPMTALVAAPPRREGRAGGGRATRCAPCWRRGWPCTCWRCPPGAGRAGRAGRAAVGGRARPTPAAGGRGTPAGTAPSPPTATPALPRPTCASSRCSRCSAGCVGVAAGW